MTEAITIPERDAEHERVLAIIFDLSPAQAAALSCLTRVPVIDGEKLLEFTGHKPPIKVVVSRTREKLRARNMGIMSKMGVGYWIEPRDRQAIEKMIEEFVGG